MSATLRRLRDIEPSVTSDSREAPVLSAVPSQEAVYEYAETSRKRWTGYILVSVAMVIVSITAVKSGGVPLLSELFQTPSFVSVADLPIKDEKLALIVDQLTAANDFSEGKFEQAKAKLERVAATQPQTPAIWTDLAKINEKLGDFDASEKALRKALQVFPANSLALNNLGLLLIKRGDGVQAVGLLERAVELKADAKESLLNLAHAYELSKQWDKALMTYKAYLKTFKRDAQLNQKIEARLRRLHSLSRQGTQFKEESK